MKSRGEGSLAFGSGVIDLDPCPLSISAVPVTESSAFIFDGRDEVKSEFDLENILGIGREEGAGEAWKVGPAYAGAALLGVTCTVGVAD